MTSSFPCSRTCRAKQTPTALNLAPPPHKTESGSNLGFSVKRFFTLAAVAVGLLRSGTTARAAEICVTPEANYRYLLPLGVTVLALLIGTGVMVWLIARQRIRVRNLAGALGVLAAGLLVTGIVVFYAKTDAERAAVREFEFTGEEIRLDIEARLRACAQVLRSGAALFNASASVEREKWRAFNHGLQLEQQLPGIQGVGFAPLIPRTQLAEHEQMIRREGFPDYQVKPTGDRETYSAIIYLEPFTSRNRRAFGYDMLSESVRRTAMERARDEGNVALSGKVRLVQETSRDVQAGTLMFFPVYRHDRPLETVEQRRAALQGWVYSPYRMTDLLRGALQNWEARLKSRRIDFQIYDGTALTTDALLFDNQNAGEETRAASVRFTRLLPVDFAGQHWTLRFTQSGALSTIVNYQSAWFAFLGGLMISLLLFWLTLSLLSMRAQAQQMAEELTAKLQENEARLEFAMDQAQLAYWEMDIATQTFIFNDRIYALYATTAEREGGYRMTAETYAREFLPPEEQAIVRDKVARLQSGKIDEFNSEHHIRRRDGKLCYILIDINVVRDATGRVVKAYGTNQDITERKQAEEVLRAMAMRNQALLETATDGIHILDEQGNLVEANPAFCKLLGYTHEEILRLHVKDWDAQWSPEELLGKLKDLIASEGTFETRHRQKNGTLIEVEIKAIGLALEDRHYIYASARDITERKQAERALTESNHKLAQALTELRSAQETIIEQEKMRGLGQMASGVAHDFNNSLSPIIGFSELLLQHPEKRNDPAQLVKWLKNIQTCATDAATVVRQLGQFSRQKIGSQALAPVDLNQLILQVVEFTKPRWKDQMQETGNTIRIVTDLRTVPPIPGEESGLRELFINLIFNAVEASPNGGTITLCTAVESGGLRIQVRDTGQGMTEEIRQRCLEPFFTTKGPDGKGLGLSMAHSIVQRHNGKMAVESAPSHGTTITIQLPLSAGALASPIVPAISSGSPPPLTVLVVDDQASLRDVVTEYLTTEGHTVTSVETGALALKQIQDGRFDLVITDKAMPEMNGEQLAAAIHLIAPQLPVILMTGFGDSMLATGTIPAHVCVILSKPITETSLRNALAKALSQPLVN